MAATPFAKTPMSASSLRSGLARGEGHDVRGARRADPAALTRPWMASELAKAMDGHARLVSLAGVGHNDMLSSGERLRNVVTDFLDSPGKTC